MPLKQLWWFTGMKALHSIKLVSLKGVMLEKHQNVKGRTAKSEQLYLKLPQCFSPSVINSYPEASPVPSPSHAYPCRCPWYTSPELCQLDLSHFCQSEDVRDPLGKGCEPLITTASPMCSALVGLAAWEPSLNALLREQLCPLLGMMTSLQPEAPDFYLLQKNIFPSVLVLRRQHGTGD